MITILKLLIFLVVLLFLNSDLTKSKTHIRESRDSEEHPESFPVFIALDETGSFVYRSYLTRHGKGPVGDSVFKEIQNPYEFNEELVLYGINHVQSKFKGWYPTRAIETCCDIH